MSTVQFYLERSEREACWFAWPSADAPPFPRGEGSTKGEAILHLLKQQREDATGQPALTEAEVFSPCWPKGIEQGKHYRVDCDDYGRDGGAWLRVFVANDGDVHASMQELEREGGHGEIIRPLRIDPHPHIRVRTVGAGGGRNSRTRQALLWLARAIQLDAEEQERAGLAPEMRSAHVE